MSKRCIFCNAPILSDYTAKVYFTVKRLEKLSMLGELTAKGIAEHLKMSICQANNYLTLLCQLEMVNRIRKGNKFYYRKGRAKW